MDVRVEQVSPLVKKLTITVEAAAVDRQLERSYAALRQEVKLPGFRRGHVPRKVLEERFGPDVALQAAGELVREVLPQALAKEGLEPVAEPALEQGKLRKGKPFSFSATVELMPTIELRDTEGLDVTLEQVEVSDAQVADQLASMRRQAASIVAVEESRPVGDGDVATVKLTLRSEGYPDHELDQLRFGLPDDHSAEFIRELVIGVRPGESRSGTVHVPMAYPDPIWAGATCEATVAVGELHRVELPELDDAFASKMGHPSLAELRSAVRDGLAAAMEQRARVHAERRLVEQLIEKNPFDVPHAMVERRAKVLVRAIAAELIPGSAAQQPSLDDLEPDKRADLLREAEFAVRQELILQAVAQREGLEVSEEERAERIAAIAEQTRQPVEAVRGYMEDGGGMAALDARLLEVKALALVFERAQQRTES